MYLFRSSRIIRDVANTAANTDSFTSDNNKKKLAATENDGKIRIYGVRIEGSDKKPESTDDGVPELMVDTKVTLRLFGYNFKKDMYITLTEERHNYDVPCVLPATGQFKVKDNSVGSNTVLVDIIMPKGTTFFYLCAKNADDVVNNGHNVSTTLFFFSYFFFFLNFIVRQIVLYFKM